MAALGQEEKNSLSIWSGRFTPDRDRDSDLSGDDDHDSDTKLLWNTRDLERFKDDEHARTQTFLPWFGQLPTSSAKEEYLYYSKSASHDTLSYNYF